MPANPYLLQNLCKAFEGEKIGAAYARQLPKKDCRLLERYTRSFNYPKESKIKSQEDLPKLGIKTYFCSNVCAAYRKDVYDSLGGFEERTIFNEDMILAGKIIQSGYRIAYAAVSYTHLDVYKRQVYGVQEKQPIKETALPVPINHYGSVKLCIENVIRTFNTQLHTKMRIARISNPYGPGQDYHKGVGFVDAAVKRTLRGECLEIWGDGENIRDYIYIDDVCGMLEALIDYEGDEEVFNLSSNDGISQNRVVEILKQLNSKLDVAYKEARSVDVRKIVLDNSKIRSIYPKKLRSFKEGITCYYEYLKSKGWEY